jgi:uncharacterized spore protein YtfJ
MSLEKTGSADAFIGTMAEKLGAVARAPTVFGEPVQRDGITVIPVAKARWGFGGGAGHRKDEDGAGGGVQVTPVGLLTSRTTQQTFDRSELCPSPGSLREVFSGYFCCVKR